MAKANNKPKENNPNLQYEIYGFRENGEDVNIPILAIKNLIESSLSGVTNNFILSETPISDGAFTTNSLNFDNVTTLHFNNNNTDGLTYLEYFQLLDNNKDDIFLKINKVGFEINAVFRITNVTFNTDETTTFTVELYNSLKRGSFELNSNYSIDFSVENYQPDYNQTDNTKGDFIKNKPVSRPKSFIDGLETDLATIESNRQSGLTTTNNKRIEENNKITGTDEIDLSLLTTINKDSIKDAINENKSKTDSNEADITTNVNSISSLTSGVQYAIPQSGNTSLNEPTPIQNGIYRASSGTYTNWGGTVVPSTVGYIYDIVVSNVETTPVYKVISVDLNIEVDEVPTKESNNFVNSGNIFNADIEVIKQNYTQEVKVYGYEGTDATYTRGSTRINGEELIEDLEIEELTIFGQGTTFKILELTRNEDLTFNFKQVVFDGFMSTGSNSFNVPHPNFKAKTVSKGSYLAVYSVGGGSGANISYATGGNGFSVAGEITGDNVTAPSSGINMNFAVKGKPLNSNKVFQEVNMLEKSDIVVLGNKLTQDGSSETTLGDTNIIDLHNEKTAKIQSINVLVTTAGKIYFNLYKKLESGNFSFSKQLVIKEVIVGVNNIEVDVDIEENTYFGFWSTTAKVAWSNNGYGYKIAGLQLGEDFAITPTSANFSINFDLLYPSMQDLDLDVKNLQDIESFNPYDNTIKSYGFNGVDTNYTSGNTRINNIQVLEDLEINNLKINCGVQGTVKILELTRNVDETFNLKQVLYDGRVNAGSSTVSVNHPSWQNKTVSKGSYLGVFSTSSGGATISFGDGDGFSFTGELVGDNNTASFSLINVNFSISGTPINSKKINEKLEDVKLGNTEIVGNALDSINDGFSNVNWVNLIGQPTVKNGYIKKINCLNTVGGVLTVIKYKKLTGDNFKFLGTVGEFNTVVGENNIDLNYYLEKDVHLGFFSSSAVLNFSSNGVGYRVAGYPNKQTNSIPITSANFSINFEIETANLQQRLIDLEKIKRDNLEGIIFDLKDDITSDYTVTGEWSGTDSPTTLNSMLHFNKPNGFDKSLAELEIKLLDAVTSTRVIMCQKDRGIYVDFNLATQNIFIHQSWGGDVNVIGSALAVGNIPFTLDQNETYILQVEKDTVKTVNATIINKNTLETFTISHVTTGDSDTHGDSAGSFGVIYKAGTFTRNRLSQFSIQKTRPTLQIIGDSFVFGYNLIRYGLDSELRYPQLIKDELNGDCTICSTGGEDSNGLLLKWDTDLSMIKARYVLLAIGLNDDLLSSSTYDEFRINMSKLIRKIKENGSIPILCTYPRLNGSGVASSYNSWIRNYTGEKYVDFHRVTTTSGNVGAPPNSGLYYLADGHPNVLGNQRYFEKFKLDCPYVFS